jgi:anti-sigma regulatory factor (Ser/Thr protein kinase)
MVTEETGFVGDSPTAPLPALTAPVCDDFSVRITVGLDENGAPDGEFAARWVGRLRRLSGAKLRTWGLAELVDDAQLLVSELVTNALQHGDQRGGIDVRLVITLKELLVSVNDGSANRPQLRIADADSESGRGLFLVAALADDWGVSPDGTTTWCTLSPGGAGR